MFCRYLTNIFASGGYFELLSLEGYKTKQHYIITVSKVTGEKDNTGWGCTLCDLTSLAHFFTSACFSGSITPFALKPHKNYDSTKSLTRKVILPSDYLVRDRKKKKCGPFTTLISFLRYSFTSKGE